MGKRLVSLLLIFTLTLGLVLPVRAVGGTQSRSVVYVPLDDRPFNDQRVTLMAQSLGIDLIMPDQALYATKLDGQSLNPNGTQSGDREALFAWLKTMDRSYDTFIISLDQLLSGGLMNSRCMDENQTLNMPGGTVTEYQVIDYLAELAQNNTVYIIDSVLRLASSCNYGGYDLDHYTLFRLYGQAPRPVLTEPSAEAVTAAYRFSPDGTPAYLAAGLSQEQIRMLLSPLELYRDQAPDPAVKAAYLAGQDPAMLIAGVTQSTFALPEAGDSALNHYLKIRQRKLLLTEYALKNLSGLDNVHYLLGIDDSSPGNNIQSNEIALFSQYLTGENHLITSSLDGLGQMALAKLFLTEHPASPRVQVTYFGDGTDDTPAFSHDTIRAMTDQTLAYLGAVQTGEAPELSVLVVTGCTGEDSRRENLLHLVSRLNENEFQQIPTILIDASSNQEPLLDQLLVENVHLSMLLSFSGQYELPNYTTMALSQGLARYRALLEPDLRNDAAQEAHLENLFSALVKEIVYMDQVKAGVTQALQDMGLDPQNFGALDDAAQARAEELLAGQMNQAAAALLDNLAGNYIASLAPYTRESVSQVRLEQCVFPWLRQAEIDLTLDLTRCDSPAETGEFHEAYVSGVTGSTFAPDGSLTRAQAAKLLVTVSELPVTDQEPPFPDMEGWAEAYILAAYQAGLVSGYPDGTYRPDSSISRAEFAQVVYSLIQNTGRTLEPVTQAAFVDVDRDGAWYAPAVYALADAGLMGGYPGDVFLPEAPITRAEAVVVLNRMLGRTEALTPGLTELGRFSDVPRDWRFDFIQEASVSHFCGG